MALNASGPISLAGSTAGQSIAVELGQSATGTISLNDTAVRNLAGVPSGAIIMPTNFWGKSSATYWIGRLYTFSASNSTCRAVAVDSSDNMYVFGNSADAGTSDFQLAKYNPTGAIQWQRRLSSTSSEEGYGVAVDSSANVYVCGYSNFGGFGIQIAKYDTSGVIQWQRRLFNVIDIAYSIAVDSSANVYVCGGTYNSVTGAFDLGIIKYNTSGTLQWQRSLSNGTSDTTIGYGVAVDSSANVYVGGRQPGSFSTDILIAKYNTSGTLQWQRRLSSANDDLATSIAVDSSANVYVCGRSDAGTNDLFLAKYNTSGVIQWQLKLMGAAEIGYGVAVDSSANVYITGFTTASGGIEYLIAKYNTSGTIQWQRTLGASGVNDYSYAIAVTSSGTVYVSGTTDAGGDNNYLFARLPGDGSRTGTYSVAGTSYTYAASSLTSTTSSITESAASLIDAASSMTPSTSTLTDASTTLLSSVTTI